MKLSRIAGALTIVAIGLATLTACDPPYPPELQVKISEQYPVCTAGEVPLGLASNVADALPTFQDVMSTNCPDMMVSAGDTNSPIQISRELSEITKDDTYATVPYYLDGGAAVVNFSDGSEVTLSLKTLFAILSGSITDWSDKAITKENRNVALASLPITVNPVSDGPSLQSLEDWAKIDGVTIPSTLLTKAGDTSTFDFYSSADGEITIVPISYASNQAFPMVSISVKNKYETGLVTPSTDSLYAAGTQAVTKVSGGKLSATIDPAKAPLPAPGNDKADLPYQAAFFGWMTLSGKSNALDRSVARYLLRQDAQSALINVSISSLPTSLRLAATNLVSVGLKLPKKAIIK